MHCSYYGDAGHNIGGCELRKAGVDPPAETTGPDETPAVYQMATQVGMESQSESQPLPSQLTNTLISQLDAESSQARTSNLQTEPLLEPAFIMSNLPAARPVPPTTATKKGRARATVGKRKATTNANAAKKTSKKRKP